MIHCHFVILWAARKVGPLKDTDHKGPLSGVGDKLCEVTKNTNVSGYGGGESLDGFG